MSWNIKEIIENIQFNINKINAVMMQKFSVNEINFNP